MDIDLALDGIKNKIHGSKHPENAWVVPLLQKIVATWMKNTDLVGAARIALKSRDPYLYITEARDVDWVGKWNWRETGFLAYMCRVIAAKNLERWYRRVPKDISLLSDAAYAFGKAGLNARLFGTPDISAVCLTNARNLFCELMHRTRDYEKIERELEILDRRRLTDIFRCRYQGLDLPERL
ncbi:MAG: hypothetical protein ABH817_02600 [archaeon]